ncbi:uncharacterized protein [Penaeus vannamei]|uniref:uncharacterized protein n=1 Tax=Penaeus vannamei TaxID=6689 RepID=UPI00387FA067
MRPVLGRQHSASESFGSSRVLSQVHDQIYDLFYVYVYDHHALRYTHTPDGGAAVFYRYELSAFLSFVDTKDAAM